MSLVNLTLVWLSGNSLDGTVPDLHLPALRDLRLSHNPLTGTLPTFDGAPFLTRLIITDTQITGVCFVLIQTNLSAGTLPSFINNGKMLDLRLSNNRLFGTLPAYSHWNNILRIELFLNQLSGNPLAFSRFRFICISKAPFRRCQIGQN